MSLWQNTDDTNRKVRMATDKYDESVFVFAEQPDVDITTQLIT